LQGNLRILIRNEIPNDIAAISTLIEAAFKNAPHSSHTEHFIVDALRAAKALTISLVAETDNSIIGHVAISPISITDGSKNWYGLGPISVLPEYQRQGIGSALMTHVLTILKTSKASGCVVLGDPDYYKRFGFKPDSTLILPGVPPEYFQTLPIASKPPQGEVSYHKAFSVKD
jgi:putative acetyltransferase